MFLSSMCLPTFKVLGFTGIFSGTLMEKKGVNPIRIPSIKHTTKLNRTLFHLNPFDLWYLCAKLLLDPDLDLVSGNQSIRAGNELRRPLRAKIVFEGDNLGEGELSKNSWNCFTDPSLCIKPVFRREDLIFFYGLNLTVKAPNCTKGCPSEFQIRPNLRSFSY